MDLATALIWTLRIVLPIVLFCIYFKLQSQKDEQYPGPTKHVHSRAKILARRKVVLEDDPIVPDSLDNLTMVDPQRAPQLFQAPTRVPRMAGGRREDRPPRERGERGERRERGERGEKGEKRDKSITLPEAEKPAETTEEAEQPAEVDPQQSSSEEKMHLESLLNYVAFNRKDPQRTFLPDEDNAPPPPPPPKSKRPDVVAASAVKPESGVEGPPATRGLDIPGISQATKEKANEEAQMVLRGAISLKTADVAKGLYEQLVESKVEISERTFALMIEACVLAEDLKSASDLLMKMETSGYCPETELLDKVMDLYSQQKVQREQDKPQDSQSAEPGMDLAGGSPIEAALEVGQASFEMSRSLGGLDAPPVEEVPDGPRSKLSSEASIFVPMMGPPPPPPPTTGGAWESSTDAITAQRTALCASAKPFQPTLNYVFDPYMHTWSIAPTEEGKTEKKENSKPEKKYEGKGEKNGKGGKDKGKGRDKGHEDKTEKIEKTEKSAGPKSGKKEWVPAKKNAEGNKVEQN